MENRDKWTDSEVQAFLTLFAAADTVQRGFDSSRRNKKVFAEISSELSSMGIYHTAKQCRDKLKKLKQDYKRIKDYNNQSGPYSRTGKWYQALDAVLGQRPEYGGTLGLEEPAEACLEATCEPVSIKDETTEIPVLAETSICSDVSGCQSPGPSHCSTPSQTSSPPPQRPGKRKRMDSILSVLREIWEQDEERCRQSEAHLQTLLHMFQEWKKSEAAEQKRLERLEAEAVEARRQQTVFQSCVLGMLSAIMPRVQTPPHPELD
ncbi:uncharacterized protein KZ484_021493 isoform 1-T1 [Pholidichthys leucotaenia]